MLDCLGTLDRPQLACTAGLLQRPIYVASALPDTEKGFPTIKINPAKFCEQILTECQAEELPTSMFLVEDHAGLVLEKDSRLCQAKLSESMSPDSGTDSDGSDTEETVKNKPDYRSTTFLFWIETTVRNPEHTREILNDTRDVIIRCLRNNMPKTPETDDVLDHMLAGAYLRQMMVVNCPEQGANAQTAIFCVASFEDSPQTLVFKFLAGSSQGYNAPAGPLNFPKYCQAMIALEKAHLQWLGQDIALKIAKPPSITNLENSNDNDASAKYDDDQQDDVKELDGSLSDEIKVWEQSSSIDIPTVHYKSVSMTTMSMEYAGVVQVVQVKQKAPYCDELWASVSKCFIHTCLCKKPADPSNPSLQRTGGSSYKSPAPTLVAPLVQ